MIVVSAFVVHSGWHWMTDRAAVLGRYDVNWSAAAWRAVTWDGAGRGEVSPDVEAGLADSSGCLLRRCL